MGCTESSPVNNNQYEPLPERPPSPSPVQHQLQPPPNFSPVSEHRIRNTIPSPTNIPTTSPQAPPMSTRKFVEAVTLVANRYDLKFCLNDSEASKIIEVLIDKQQEFKRKSAPTHVTVGYHYTLSENLSKIVRQSFLMLESTGQNGSYYGKGLYTANNPGAFSNFGPTGLMCAVIRGVVQRIDTGGMDQCTVMDTGIGNKGVEQDSLDFDEMAPLYDDEYVLRSPQQCVPLICYYAGPDVLCDTFFARLQECQTDLQRLLDHFFNEASLIPPQRVAWPLDQYPDHFYDVAPTLMQIPIRLPSSVFNIRTTGWFVGHARHDFSLPAIFPYTAPTQLLSTRAPCYSNSFTFLTQAELQTAIADDRCSICSTPYVYACQSEVVKLLKCKHLFHRHCLASSLKTCSTCPTCRQNLAELHCTSPSGIMSLKGISESCAGYEASLTVVIEYTMQDGTQEEYHPNPGVDFATTTRQAYVPYFQNEGWNLLKRLIWAFQHGLTFQVGTSLTTGLSNVITWSSIPHKTLRIEGGEHGFPDSKYLTKCNTELTRLGVPLANELGDAGMSDPPKLFGSDFLAV